MKRIKSGYYYFQSEQEVDNFIYLLKARKRYYFAAQMKDGRYVVEV